MTILLALVAFTRKHSRLVLDGALVMLTVFAVLLVFGKVYHMLHRVPYEPVETTSNVLERVKTLTLNTPVLTEKVITKTISDPAEAALVKALLAENARLKASVTSATVATVESVSTGGGEVTEVPAASATEPAGIHFVDWRLDFTAAGSRAEYTLKQKFDIIVSTGRRADGSPLALAYLYEIGPGETRVQLSTIQTTTVFADQTSPHWMRGLGVQAGVAASRDALGSTATSGVVALQWLSKGRTKAAEDTSFTILAPAVVLGSGVQDFGLVPFAVNLGRLPHQPLSNIWAGVFVAKSQRIGFTLTAKF